MSGRTVVPVPGVAVGVGVALVEVDGVVMVDDDVEEGELGESPHPARTAVRNEVAAREEQTGFIMRIRPAACKSRVRCEADLVNLQ
jgi:hypothetical protein